VAEAGSDWEEWRVHDVDTGADLPDRLQWVKFSTASWTPDGKGFYYSRFDEPGPNQLRDVNYFQKLHYHRLGTPQSADRLVYERKDQKEWTFGAVVSDDALAAGDRGWVERRSPGGRRGEPATGPVLIRIETRAGHAAGKPTTKKNEQAADMLAFTARALGLPGGR
jgi:prolyl oligopeptidase